MTHAEDAPLPRVAEIREGGAADDRLALPHEARTLRRRRLVSEAGVAFLIDLPRTTHLEAGSVLVLDSGLRVAVAAADEPLLEVRGDLVRIAWHIGNRHAPCEIGADHLRVRDDHVMADMLAALGAETRPVSAPFRPEGGAYGHGQTHGHDHEMPPDAL